MDRSSSLSSRVSLAWRPFVCDEVGLCCSVLIAVYISL